MLLLLILIESKSKSMSKSRRSHPGLPNVYAAFVCPGFPSSC